MHIYLEIKKYIWK